MPTDTLWGHPKGLYVLFFTEMWERFSYYGMRALLVYYMIKHLMFSQENASQIYGLYTGLVFFTPFFGGLLADRVLGQRRTVIVGGVLMAAGHFAMAFEALFFPALLLLIVGCGAFLPNVSAQVGALYAPDDERRDRAFSIFYVGSNLGAFLSPLICGTLGEVYGWHYGFGAAGVGMAVGLGIYLYGQRWLAPDHLALQHPAAAAPDAESDLQDRRRVWGLLTLCLPVMLFWAAYEQDGNTMALWADTDTDRHLFGWEVPASWFQALNPAFIFLLTPAITLLWAWQGRRGWEPSSLMKMAIGCFLLAGGFLVMYPPGDDYDMDGTPVSMFWLVGFDFMLTLGELYLAPVGLSLVCKLAPVRMVSMLMGVWFLARFAGNYAAGFLGRFWEAMPRQSFFLMGASIAVLAGMMILLRLRSLHRTIGATV